MIRKFTFIIIQVLIIEKLESIRERVLKLHLGGHQLPLEPGVLSPKLLQTFRCVSW